MRAREERIEAAYESGLWDAVREHVPLRHPSQLYEASAEGVLLGLILWGVLVLARRRGVRLPDGTYGGVRRADVGQPAEQAQSKGPRFQVPRPGL